MFSIFDNELDLWNFNDICNPLQLNECFNDDFVHNIVTELYDNQIKYKEVVFIDKNNKEFRFVDSIPTRWLYEDFEQEIIDGKKKYEDIISKRREEQKSKRLNVKEKNKEQKKILSALGKKELSESELEMLKKIL